MYCDIVCHCQTPPVGYTYSQLYSMEYGVCSVVCTFYISKSDICQGKFIDAVKCTV